MDGDQWIRGVLVPSSGHAWNHSHIPEESLLMAIRATCSWWEIDFAQCRLLMSDITVGPCTSPFAECPSPICRVGMTEGEYRTPARS